MPALLHEYYKKNFLEARAQLLANAPDHLNAAVSDRLIHEHVLKLMDLDNRERAFLDNVTAGAAKLKDEELIQVHRSLLPLPRVPVQPSASAGKDALAAYETDKRRYDRALEREQSFIQELRRGNSHVLDSIYIGDDEEIPAEKILAALGEALGPAAEKAILETPLKLPMLYPDLPAERTWQPRKEEIDALIEKHTHSGDRTRDAENRRLLDRAGQILENIKPEVLEAVNDSFNASPKGGFSVDSIVEGRAGTAIHRGLELLDSKGLFTDISAPTYTTNTGAPMHNGTTDTLNRPLRQEDWAVLDTLKDSEGFGLSQATREALVSIENHMKQLDYRSKASRLLNSNLFPPFRPTEEGQKYVHWEQAYKYYAFSPVTNAKIAVGQAVLSGNLEAIAAAVKEYDRVEAITDAMMQTLRSDRLSDEPFYSSNVNSTRSTTRLIPAKYVLDYTNHNKLNSLNVLYSSLQNAKLSVRDLMDDPVGVCEKLADQFLQAGGLDGRPDSIGAALQNGMKGHRVQSPSGTIAASWDQNCLGLFRGLVGIAGLEKDPDRRNKFLAAAHMGLMRATLRIQKEQDLYNTEQQVVNSPTVAGRAMRGVIYQTAALAPETGEKRFNLRSLIEDFSEPLSTRPAEAGPPQPDEPRGIKPEDYPEPPNSTGIPSTTQKNNPDQAHTYSWWKGHAAVQAMVRDTDHVDYRELAGRNAKVLAEAAQEMQFSGSFDSEFVPDLYLLYAWSAQSRLLDNADRAGRTGPDVERFRKSLTETWKLAETPSAKAALYLAANRDALDLLKQGRDGQPTLRDSGEYTDMKDSLDQLLAVHRRLMTGNPENITSVYSRDMDKKLEAAKQNAFRYVRRKMKNGSKPLKKFVYESGVNRAEEGLALWKKLGQTQDELGLRSPAQKLLDESREALLQNRADPAWVEKDGLKTLAKLLYADSLIQAGMPPEEQKSCLTGAKLESGAQAICEQLAAEKKLWDKNGPVTHALRQDESFRRFADKWAVPMKEAYDKKLAPARLAQAKRDVAKGYALDLACKELGVGDTSPLRTEKYGFLDRTAEEIMKRPDFREVMERMTEGKTLEAVKKLHPLARPFFGNATGTVPTRYAHTVQTLAYEKRCAALAAEASLRCGGKKPGQKQIGQNQIDRKKIDQLADTLRKNPDFRRFIADKVRDRNPDEVETMVKELAKPEIQRSTVEEITGKVNPPKAARQAQPAVKGQLRPAVKAANPEMQEFKNKLGQMIQSKKS